MRKTKYYSILLFFALLLALALTGCQETSKPSQLPYEAIHLGGDLFVITKTSKDSKVNLHLPLVAQFDDPQDLPVGDVVALDFDQLMESFPPQAVITDSEKLPGEGKTYTAGFSLAQQLLEIRPDNTFLVDVRTVEEFESGHVPNSINIPVDQIESIVDRVPDKENTILLYCRSGRRSATAAKELLRLGYKVIFDLGGVSDYDGDLKMGTD